MKFEPASLRSTSESSSRVGLIVFFFCFLFVLSIQSKAAKGKPGHVILSGDVEGWDSNCTKQHNVGIWASAENKKEKRETRRPHLRVNRAISGTIFSCGFIHSSCSTDYIGHLDSVSGDETKLKRQPAWLCDEFSSTEKDATGNNICYRFIYCWFISSAL